MSYNILYCIYDHKIIIYLLIFSIILLSEGIMKKNDVLEEIIDIKKMDVPVIFHHNRLDKINGRGVFSFHWHNKIELLYMTSGEAVFTCNRTEVTAKKGDLIVVNCNELHSGQTKTDVSEYYCFIVDYSFFGALK